MEIVNYAQCYALAIEQRVHFLRPFLTHLDHCFHNAVEAQIKEKATVLNLCYFITYSVITPAFLRHSLYTDGGNFLPRSLNR